MLQCVQAAVPCPPGCSTRTACAPPAVVLMSSGRASKSSSQSCGKQCSTAPKHLAQQSAAAAGTFGLHDHSLPTGRLAALHQSPAQPLGNAAKCHATRRLRTPTFIHLRSHLAILSSTGKLFSFTASAAALKASMRRCTGCKKQSAAAVGTAQPPCSPAQPLRAGCRHSALDTLL